MEKHRGESSKMGQAGSLPQAAASGLQVQTRSKITGVAQEERGNEHDEREVGYSPRAEEAQSGAPTGKRSHKERLSTVETHLDVLEASLEELYQGQGRLLGVESLQEEAESRIDKVESLVDRLTEDTKDSVRHLHEVVAELTAKPSRSTSLALAVAIASIGDTIYLIVAYHRLTIRSLLLSSQQ
ncbi:hypothetical protein B296_00002347 [Ensete ventricosum]|uniref:Uncharacterized protein n=1 Tax=Ensete ventricosum TaxID=4639 RepID=A0A427AHL5_ENSVE|nr:hypothetical protein B296_00002347 [Ensete ventricosum]